ncbi:MAG: hypothetical protein RH942_13475 [Kiloniellaceae bacterium]
MTGRTRHLTLKIVLFLLGLWLTIMAIALPLASLPDSAGGRMLVLFPPSLGPNARLLAIVEAGGRPILQHAGGRVWLAESETPGFAGRLQAAGAWAAYAPTVIAVLPQGGCFYISVHPPGPPQPHPPI